MTQKAVPQAGLAPAQISEAFVSACLSEVRAFKPGNVHIYAGGHGMQVADFEESARVAAPYISNSKLRTGERILRAVEATFAAVHCNTNLGILLLCAPLAVAAELPQPDGTSLQARLRQVLAQFDATDTAHVFQAIAAASPGGLGDDNKSDVKRPPPLNITLLDAMAIASHRDLIAQEYVSGFERIFALHTHEFTPRIAQGWSALDAIARVYLHALARIPDTRPSAPDAKRALLGFDAGLKADGRNPGSLADLMAAILFVSALGQQSDAIVKS